MNRAKEVLKLILCLTMSALGSTVPFLFVAPFVRVVYVNYPKKVFWSTYLFAVVILTLSGFAPIAVSLLSAVLLVGIFSEVLELKRGVFVSGFISVLTSALVTVAIPQLWLSSIGLNLAVKLREQIDLVLTQAHQLNSTVKVDAEFLYARTPSILISLLILSLAFALILQGPLKKLFKFKNEKQEALDLVNFRLPDICIWVAMLSFLFSFINLKSDFVLLVGANFVNIMVILYFLQGLAVIEALLRTLRLGLFVRILTYFVFLAQLFFLVAAIGIIDFWFEFRKRFIHMRLKS